MRSLMTTHLRKIAASVLLVATLAAPFAAFADSNSITSVGAGWVSQCGAGLLQQAIGYAIGLGLASLHQTTVTAANKAEALIAVPLTRPITESTATENAATGQGQKDALQSGDFYENLQQKFMKLCLDPLWQQIAIAIVKQMRNMVITYINTGNFGGKPTFVTNFQFDARQTASNAARLFASNLTNINFCNYFPQNPAVNLNFELNLRIGLQCSYQQSREQFQQHLANANLRTPFEDVMLLMPENDPLKVAIAQQEKLSTQVAQATQARQNQVVGGKGYIGVETCTQTKVTTPAYCMEPISGSSCGAPVGVNECPPDCIFIAAVTSCADTKVQTPGSFVADIATEPLKSEFRQNEVINTFAQAIQAIVDALISKVITTGLSSVGL